MSGLADERARQRAVTVMDRNMVVTAGAGTGKTTLLVDRMTHLLFRQPEPVPIGAIVALTFTNKAANEMKVRLHDRLRLWQVLNPAQRAEGPGACRERDQMNLILARYGLGLERLRELAREALAGLEKSQLGTIHSFAAHLLRLYPHEGGVDPEFLEDDGSRFADYVEQQWRLWLDEELGAGGADHAAWRTALAAVSLEEIRELAVRLCNELVSLEATVEAVAGEATGASMPEAIRRWAGTLRDQAVALRAAHPKTNTLEQMLDAVVAVLDRWAGGAGLSASERWLPPELDRAVPAKTSGWTKEDHAAAKAVIEATKRLTTATLAPLAPLMGRLVQFAGACRQGFVDNGYLSFDGLLARARNVLRDHPIVRRALKQQFLAILVDEFQDTDPVQYELVLYLAEVPDRQASRWQDVELQPGKLFVVGDPKQSIYAFRRADMDAYDRVIDGVILGDGAQGESQVLQTNFRSHVQLLAPINACFDRLFPAVAQKGLQPKNEPLVPFATTATAAPDEGLSVRLVRPRTDEADSETATRCEAESLARWLAEEVLHRQTIIEGDVLVTIQPRHVAVLLRTLTAAREYIEALRRHGIPYVTEGEKHFFARQEVIDLGNLLCACFRPHDEITLAAVLRSPLGGLTDRELEDLVSAGGLDVQKEPPNGMHSAARLYRLLQDLRMRLPRLPVAEGVDYLYRVAPLQELAAATEDGEQAVANLQKLRRLLIQAGEQPGASWRTLLSRLRRWFRERPDEAESPLAEEESDLPDREGAVRVLSVHKAKGLEFPMVVLAGLHRGTDRREDRIAVHQDWSSGLVGVQVGSFRTVEGVYISAKLAERQRAEERRILYVAMTRAKRRLVLSAGLPSTPMRQGENGLSLVSAGWEVELAEAAPGVVQIGGVSVPIDVVEGDELPLTQLGRETAWKSDTTFSQNLAERWDARRSRWVQVHGQPRYLTATGLVKQADYPSRTRRPVERPPQATTLANRVGICVHRLLEQWDFAKGIEQLAALWHVNDLSGDAALRDEVARLFDVFVASSFYGDLRRADILGREVPFTIKWEGDRLWAMGYRSDRTAGLPLSPIASSPLPNVCVLEGVIDLLYRLDGRLWIADYKTDHVTEAELDSRVEHYRPQAEAYKVGVLHALGVASVGFQFVFMRIGRTVMI